MNKSIDSDLHHFVLEKEDKIRQLNFNAIYSYETDFVTDYYKGTIERIKQAHLGNGILLWEDTSEAILVDKSTNQLILHQVWLLDSLEVLYATSFVSELQLSNLPIQSCYKYTSTQKPSDFECEIDDIKNSLVTLLKG